ncbi:MAG: hypothetical protein AB1650_08415 [Candidatus Omnitrophota bacterium]
MVDNGIAIKSLFEGIEYRVARSREELEKAYRLVYQEYRKQGYLDENTSKLQASVYNALPQTTTFVALVDDVVTATATIIPDSPLELPMDDLYHAELNELRGEGKKLCEVSMLASSSELFGEGVSLMLNAKKMFLIFFLFKYIFDYVRIELGVDYICIAVNPKHANTYDSLFFKNLGGGMKYYSKVNGAPAIAKCLNVQTVDEQCISRGRQSLYKMFLTGPADRDKFSRKVELKPEDLKYFFVEKIKVFRDATPQQLSYLKSCYPSYDFSRIIS